MRLTRREMLKVGLVGGAATALPIGKAIATLTDVITDEVVESPRVPAFRVPLNIPPVLRPVRSDATTDFYELTQRVARVPIIPGLPRTTIWGYDGITPAPTIMQRAERTAVVRQINRLPVEVTVHRHGGDQPPQFDGYPLDLIEPGEEFDYVYPGGVHEAATIWYHDHAIHETGRNVWMGLAGFFLISDAHERSLPLPKGRFDVPLVIQDRFFFRDGSIRYPLEDPEENKPLRQGAFGDVILVNGTPKPFLRVLRRKYRFRTLNGSNARVYRLALSTGDPLTVIATDDGLLAHPVQTDTLFTTPAERYEVIIDFSRYPVGAKVILENRAESIGDTFDQEKTRQVMRFDVVDDARDPSSVPRDLSEREDLPAPVATREFRFDRSGGQWTINNQPFDENRIDARVRLGTTEIWRFVNNSGGWLHPIHPHGSRFFVQAREEGAVQPYERGPKDTVSLGPNQTVRVLLEAGHFRGRFVFHCHNIEHEDFDMMAQIEYL